MKQRFLLTLLLIGFSTQGLSLYSYTDSSAKAADQVVRHVGLSPQVLWKSITGTITSYDLVKQMDLMLLHQGRSIPANLKQDYYKASWQSVLQNMVERDLILQQAHEKDFKVERHEVIDEITRRLGNNYIVVLDKENIPLNDLIEDIEKELLVQRMIYIKVHYKAQRALTLGAISERYNEYLRNNPARTLVTFDLYTLKTKADSLDSSLGEALLDLEKRLLSQRLLSDIELKEMSEQEVSISRLNFNQVDQSKLNELLASKAQELSEGALSYWNIPEAREANEPNTQAKLIHLLKREEEHPKSLNTLRDQLEHELFNIHLEKASQAYIKQLYSTYEEELSELTQRIERQEIHPFS